MRVVFLDTWFLVAFVDPFDQHHRNARRLMQAYGGHTLVTHTAVLTELLTFFSAEGAMQRSRAIAAARRALTEFVLVDIDRALFVRGMDLYARRPDKEYSLVDCISMQIMKERGITQVFTNDHHFAQEGFVVLSDAP